VDNWSYILMKDGVMGWVPSSTLTPSTSLGSHVYFVPVKSLFAHVYREPNIKSRAPLMTLPHGANVPLSSDSCEEVDWARVCLLSGGEGWIQSADLKWDSSPKSVEQMLQLSLLFQGLPYTWGGTSSYGYDCSGFVQMLFLEMGIQLPRNAKDQAASDLLVSVSKEDLVPGDLVFFGLERVSHVGLYLGEGLFIHSGVQGSPLLRVDRLDQTPYVWMCGRRLGISKLP
jgi:cell wall-associated NlpC family hydrolase